MAHPSPFMTHFGHLYISLPGFTSQALAANFWSRLCSSGVSKRSASGSISVRCKTSPVLSGGCAQRSDAIFASWKHLCEADHFKKDMLDPKARALFRRNGEERVISPSLSLSYKFSQSARTCCWRRGNKTWGLPHKKALSPDALRIWNQMMNAGDPIEKKKEKMTIKIIKQTSGSQWISIAFQWNEVSLYQHPSVPYHTQPNQSWKATFRGGWEDCQTEGRSAAESGLTALTLYTQWAGFHRWCLVTLVARGRWKFPGCRAFQLLWPRAFYALEGGSVDVKFRKKYCLNRSKSYKFIMNLNYLIKSYK